MKKSAVTLFALLAIVVMVSGCSSQTKASLWRVSAGVDTSLHAFEGPHVDFGSDGAASIEVGAGLFTVGGNAKLNEHDPNGPWASFSFAAGPTVEK